MTLPDKPAQPHRAVAAAFGERVRGTRDWDVPSPVDGWTARAVVEHLTSWFPAFLAGGAGISLPVADPDPVVAWQAQTDAWRAASATHLSVNTMGSGRAPDAHIATIRRYREVVG